MRYLSAKLLPLFLLVAPEVLAVRRSLPSPYVRNLKQAPRQQLCRAAAALAGSQGVYSDGQQAMPATWEWIVGTGRAADNGAGLSAVALSYASGRCGLSPALDAFAHARFARHGQWGFLYDADIEALARLGEAAHDGSLVAAAREAFDRRYSGANGEEIVGRWLMFRFPRSLVGYDAALAIRAAMAVGAPGRAREIADGAVSSLGAWGEGTHDDGYLATSRGAFLEALFLLDEARYAGVIKDLGEHLLLTQSADGSWEKRTQATAYGVRALALWSEELGALAAERGRRWLRLTQLASGGWAATNDWSVGALEGPMAPQVTAEVMLALGE